MGANQRTLTIADQSRRDLALTINSTIDPIARRYAELAERTTADLRRLLEEEATQIGAGVLSLETMRSRERAESVLAAARAGLSKYAAEGDATLRSTVEDEIVPLAVDYEHLAIMSQLPEAYRGFGSRINPNTLEAVVTRAADRASYLDTIPESIVDSIEAALTDGIALGDNPRRAVRRLTAEARGFMNAAGIDALRFMRTEMLDSYRNADMLTRTANADVVVGWVWWSAADERTCASCWAMHGSVFPAEAIGPDDHMNGRCTAIPEVRSDLSTGMAPLPSRDDLWERLGEAKQRMVLGPTRYDLYTSGRIGWSDLTKQYPAGRWRAYRAAPTVAELRERVASFPCPVSF